MKIKAADVGEFGLIDLIKKNIKLKKGVLVGIGDDTAVTQLNNLEYQLLTTDMLVEGVHFTLNDPLEKIGHKAIACSLSDIAAMGGQANYALVSLGIDKNFKIENLQEIYRGMEKLANRFNVSIVGGDTVKTNKLIINVSLTGKVKKKNLCLRSKARKNDYIFVTGPLGGSLKSGKHLNFMPRMDASRYLVKKYRPTSMIDISDGFVSDLNHILKASRKGAIIYERQIPICKGATIKGALYDGEDFELIFTLSPDDRNKLMNDKKYKSKFTCVGRITDLKNGFQLERKNGKKEKVEIKGYCHF